MNTRTQTRRTFRKPTRNAVRALAKELAKIKCVKAVYLFGSAARGEQKPLSDIDLCVFAEKPNRQEEAHIGGSSSPFIDVALFSNLPIYIKYRIFQEGKQLYCRDQLYLHRQRVRTVQEYLDFKPLLERHVQRTLGS